MDLMKWLEIFRGQQIHTPQKTAICRFVTIEELFRTDKWRDEVQTENNNKDLTSPVPLRVRDDLPRVLATFPVTISERQKIGNSQKDAQNAMGTYMYEPILWNLSIYEKYVYKTISMNSQRYQWP